MNLGHCVFLIGGGRSGLGAAATEMALAAGARVVFSGFPQQVQGAIAQSVRRALPT
jgi:NAD(P)-dependent dehydrogenase (short-subunit alcohol dehydrogenase family)